MHSKVWQPQSRFPGPALGSWNRPSLSITSCRELSRQRRTLPRKSHGHGSVFKAMACAGTGWLLALIQRPAASLALNRGRASQKLVPWYRPDRGSPRSPRPRASMPCFASVLAVLCEPELAHSSRVLCTEGRRGGMPSRSRWFRRSEPGWPGCPGVPGYLLRVVRWDMAGSPQAAGCVSFFDIDLLLRPNSADVEAGGRACMARAAPNAARGPIAAAACKSGTGTGHSMLARSLARSLAQRSAPGKLVLLLLRAARRFATLDLRHCMT